MICRDNGSSLYLCFVKPSMFTQKGNYDLRCLFLLIALFSLASCENNLKTVSLITSNDKNLLDVEENASIFYTDSAKTKFHLTSPRIENYGGSDPYQVFPKGLNIDFYDDSANINGHLDAEYAIRHVNSKLIEADNNVNVLNRKGERLNTEQLFWDDTKQKIYTNKFVRIKTTKQIIYGDGLVSNEDFTQYKITNIRGTIQLDAPEENDKGKK
jgi:LPS export ABC transporter protein LptC